MEHACSIHTWAQSTGAPSPAGWAFRRYIHCVFHCAEYRADKSPCFRLAMKRGRRLHEGTSTDYLESLDRFLQDEGITYWHPQDGQLPAIAAVFKYEKSDGSGAPGITCLIVATAATLVMDRQGMRELRSVFAAKDLSPRLVVLLPDQERCESFEQVAHDAEALGGLCVGFYGGACHWAHGRSKTEHAFARHSKPKEAEPEFKVAALH